MRIDNRTHWRTDQIKALIQAVAENETDAEHRKHLRVIVDYITKRGGCYNLGRAYIGTPLKPAHTMWIKLPRARHGDRPDLVRLAHTIAHEIGHLKGIPHREMWKTKRYGYVEGWRESYAWASNYSIEEQAAPPKVRVMADKLTRAQAMAEKWQSKVKRATTILKKWQRRVSIYERLALAATAAETTNPDSGPL
jgi:hypothetical protein